MKRRAPRLTLRVTMLAFVAAIVPASAAMAAWVTSGSGTGSGAAATMPTGLTPTASANGLLITVSWGSASLSSGTAVAGYTVARYNATTGSQATVGGTCAGIVTATTCTEQVTAGSWVYTDTPVQQNWTGGQSPQSSAVTALG